MQFLVYTRVDTGSYLMHNVYIFTIIVLTE